MQWHVEETGNIINKTQKDFGDRLTSIHNNVRKNNSLIDNHNDRINSNMVRIEELERLT